MRLLLTAAVASVLAPACAKRPPTHAGADLASLRRELRAEGVVVYPVQRVAELDPPATKASPTGGIIETELAREEAHLPEPTRLDPANPEHAAFSNNEWVGGVRFGGGLIRSGEISLEVRARVVELGAHDEMLPQATAWLASATESLLERARVPARAIAGAAAQAAPSPERRPSRGTHPEDGHDNVNAPRTNLVARPWTGEAPGRFVLVPYLRNYLFHNGGWFLGQEWGCTGGARVEVLLVLYDTRTGAPAWWMEATGRHIQPLKGQPSRAESDQFLRWSEIQVEEQLGRGFLR